MSSFFDRFFFWAAEIIKNTYPCRLKEGLFGILLLDEKKHA